MPQGLHPAGGRDLVQPKSGAVIDYRDWLVKRINRKRKTNVLGIS